MPKPVALIVLDGWGHREETEHNAVYDAKTPVFDELWKQWPHTLLEAGGEAVGLPEGQMGNSEIGHMTIGAGAAIDTDLVKINKAIRGEEFAANPVFDELFDHVEIYDSTLHVMGLVSDGGVHSHHAHLAAFLRLAAARGIVKIAIHAFADGRDTAPQSAAAYLKELEVVLAEIGVGAIATVTGRFYAMDRDKNWDRMKLAENAIFHGQAAHTETRRPSEVVQELYASGKLDEHLEPIVFMDEGDSFKIQDGDGVFVFNYRPDRVRMLSERLIRHAEENDLYIATMTEYDPAFPTHVAYPKQTIETTLAAEISKAGLTQQHVAETEKFPHATYFLNGGREKPHEGEEHVMLASRKDVQTHDQAPEMRAEAIADEAIKRIESGVDFTFINFANPDMVGHSGNHAAIVTAVETVDAQLGRVVEAVRARGGILFVTADHGNAELTFDAEAGGAHTSHTLNRVPAILVGYEDEIKEGTSLADIAPTILSLFKLPVPSAMKGVSLVG
jgi:2,3-bisphosphoglycerate-independent phosphoglycerate mutase